MASRIGELVGHIVTSPEVDLVRRMPMERVSLLKTPSQREIVEVWLSQGNGHGPC